MRKSFYLSNKFLAVVVLGLLYTYAGKVFAQTSFRTYESADAGGQIIKLSQTDGVIRDVQFKDLTSAKWKHTKMIQTDITQEYIKLLTLPESDTLELFLDIYFEKLVVKNGRDHQSTFWLIDENN